MTQKTYKPVTIIIDDFTYRADNFQNTSLYDFVLNPEYTFANLLIDPNTPEFIYSSDSTLTASGSSTSIDARHGDWVSYSFIEQLDSASATILIDVDSINDSYLNTTHTSLAFDNIEAIINDWLSNNNTADTVYIPVATSISFGGSYVDSHERSAIEYMQNNDIAILQAIANVSLDAGMSSWADEYSDVISVGAFNVDTFNNSLHGNPLDETSVDLYANGYIENTDWGQSTFGTSFSTPRAASEIVNNLADNFNIANNLLDNTSLSKEDILGIDTGYTDYIESMIQDMTTKLYFEFDNTWGEKRKSVMSDDIAVSIIPDPLAYDFNEITKEVFTDISLTVPDVYRPDAFLKVGSMSFEAFSIGFEKNVNGVKESTYLSFNHQGIKTDSIIGDFENIVLPSDAFNFSSSIDINDPLAVLKHIGGVLNLQATATHAADLDNNNIVDAMDVIKLLKSSAGIGSPINGFKLIDESNNVVNDFSASMGEQLTLIAMGDVNMSGEFNQNYLSTLDVI